MQLNETKNTYLIYAHVFPKLKIQPRGWWSQASLQEPWSMEQSYILSHPVNPRQLVWTELAMWEIVCKHGDFEYV